MRKSSKDVTLNEVGVTLNRFDLRMNGFGETLDQFGGRLNEFGDTLSGFGERVNDFGETLNTFGKRLNEVGEMLGFVVEHMATKEDLAEVRKELKGDIAEVRTDLFALHTQVNSVETEIRGMRHGRLEVRVADLEEKVFGDSRS
jgi:hypothetical protein